VRCWAMVRPLTSSRDQPLVSSVAALYAEPRKQRKAWIAPTHNYNERTQACVMSVAYTETWKSGLAGRVQNAICRGNQPTIFVDGRFEARAQKGRR